MIGLFSVLGSIKAAAVAWIVVIGAAGVILVGAMAPALVSARPVEQHSPAATEADGCAAAVTSRDAALARLEHDYEQALADLRTLRESTAAQAAQQNKALTGDALEAIEGPARAELAARVAAARAEIAAVADLHSCDTEDRDEDSGLIFDIADLRDRYDAIVDRALSDFKRIVRGAADRFAAALQNAPVRAPQPRSQGSSSQGD